jgi:hypothetical protein
MTPPITPSHSGKVHCDALATKSTMLTSTTKPIQKFLTRKHRLIRWDRKGMDRTFEFYVLPMFETV